jgi:hypothetical protein
VTDRAVQSNRSENASGGRHIAFLAILVLGGAWYSTALGATDSTTATACDRTADLRSLEVPVSDLSASVVGHTAVEPGDANDESLNARPAQAESTAPILYLAPRVAVILQNVFSAVAIETPPTPPLNSPDPAQSFATESLSQDESPPSPLSPVAGDASQSDSSELIDPAAEVGAVPRFQRQMFRTDI